MGNMSYCRFQNTLGDLRDCMNHITDEKLSRDEKDARLALVELCHEIVDEYESAEMQDVDEGEDDEDDEDDE